LDPVIRGCALLLGMLLVSAGIPKTVAPRYAGSSIRRVVRRSRVASDETILFAVRVLGCYEILLGVALAVGHGLTAAVVAPCALGTLVGLDAFVIAAIRRGSHCGCWASLSEGPAGGAELGRSVALTGMAGLLLVGRLAGQTSVGMDRSALVAAGACLLAMVAASRIGGWLAPVPSERLRRQLVQQAPLTAAGQAGAWLAFEAGFVHAGTDSGRRRYADARLTSNPANIERNPGER
jgi:hypothetical protein